ncbi:cytochrome-c peroxidase [Candidatus Methylacidithermus pantelleriae]|uniref:Cytochrome c551 peroxidase n=1 Tax=Candidatus Methylacidithermus pantelleriae TaxID=2744239 RepID=A0A8J2BQ06_9BACT|nr:cytochrome-c peroxidase [Candidatus Methylacidithermus pantelleriae]CAF0700721.1 Cytochrome c551 peroxidase [Candidatus Methylacidithermus pantelleriae]
MPSERKLLCSKVFSLERKPVCRKATGLEAGLLALCFLLGFSLRAFTQQQEPLTPEKGRAIFGILPRVADNPSNPVTPEKVTLGKSLFFDPRLSKSGVVSCNSCHNLAAGGVDGLPTSVGHLWQIGPRNAPTVFNAALQVAQFWDGRAKDVEEQAKGPLVNPKEMAATPELIVARLKSISFYQESFRKAFPGDKDPVTFENTARAIAAFERTLLTPSRFDRFLQGDEQALSPEEKVGLETFVQVGCISCHNGVGVGGGMFQKFGIFRKPDGFKDLGRYEVTKNEADRYVFKVPSLRNVALTAPYFTDGSVWDLGQAVRIMADVQLNRKLSDVEVKRIVSFLKSLTADPRPEMTLPTLPASTPQTPKPQLQ